MHAAHGDREQVIAYEAMAARKPTDPPGEREADNPDCRTAASDNGEVCVLRITAGGRSL